MIEKVTKGVEHWDEDDKMEFVNMLKKYTVAPKLQNVVHLFAQRNYQEMLTYVLEDFTNIRYYIMYDWSPIGLSSPMCSIILFEALIKDENKYIVERLTLKGWKHIMELPEDIAMKVLDHMTRDVTLEFEPLNSSQLKLSPVSFTSVDNFV